MPALPGLAPDTGGCAVKLTPGSAASFVDRVDRAVSRGIRNGLKEVGFGARAEWRKFAASRFDEDGPPKALTRNALAFHQGKDPSVILYLLGAGAPGDKFRNRVSPAMWLEAQEGAQSRRAKAVEKQITAMLRTTRQGAPETGLMAALGRRKPNILKALGLGDDLLFAPPGESGSAFDPNPKRYFLRGNPRKNLAQRIHNDIKSRPKRGYRYAAIKSRKGNLLLIRKRRNQKTQLLAIGVERTVYKKRFDFTDEMRAFVAANGAALFNKRLNRELKKFGSR